jgi:hypothetical protein
VTRTPRAICDTRDHQEIRHFSTKRIVEENRQKKKKLNWSLLRNIFKHRLGFIDLAREVYFRDSMQFVLNFG